MIDEFSLEDAAEIRNCVPETRYNEIIQAIKIIQSIKTAVANGKPDLWVALVKKVPVNSDRKEIVRLLERKNFTVKVETYRYSDEIYGITISGW